jgi:hypothetical protein
MVADQCSLILNCHNFEYLYDLSQTTFVSPGFFDELLVEWIICFTLVVWLITWSSVDKVIPSICVIKGSEMVICYIILVEAFQYFTDAIHHAMDFIFFVY